ncbi:MAG: NYN domain-containing protein [Deltaproteobacteria bacterium]|nr:NYN domain-containing protein [Deltaproteobacteria bacterium]
MAKKVAAKKPATKVRARRVTAKPAARAAVKPKRAAATTKPGRAKATTKRSLPAAGGARRAIFIDVENTSSEVDLMRVIDALAVDRTVQPTEVTAVGNWKSVAQGLARRLAALGAQLVHSAPATGVRDWSDLWIAVAAGCWLGQSSPGDRLEIISADRAFDAVGDLAAVRGVTFQRLSYKTVAASTTASSTSSSEPRRHSRRGGRGRRRPSTAAHTTHAPQSQSASHPVAHPAVHPAPHRPRLTESSIPTAQLQEEGRSASHEQIAAVIGRLAGGDPHRWVNLDVLANALKSEGFTRPPGSPRLVTRLRKLKDIELSPNGMVRVGSSAQTAAESDIAVVAVAPEPGAAESGAAESDAPEADPPTTAMAAPRRRSRRRGGRGRRRPNQSGTGATLDGNVVPPPPDEDNDANGNRV